MFPREVRLRPISPNATLDGKIYLLRVIVDDSVDPAVVVTAYRTTKIEK